MKKDYFGSSDKKKLYIRNWVESNSEFKKKKKISIIFKIVALLVLLVCVIGPAIILIGEKNIMQGIVAGGVVGLIIGLIPFLIGDSIKIKAFNECGKPYVNVLQECLRIYEDGVEYLYHNSTSEYSESMDVYRIPIENVNAVNYNSDFHIVTIIGEGELLAYDDYVAKRINHQKSQGKFYSNTPYSFICAFDDETEIVNTLKSMAKNS